MLNLSLLLALGASTLGSASPIAQIPPKVPNPPGTSTSQGFRLVARTTDPFYPLAAAVEGTVLEAYHEGSNYRVPILQKPDTQSAGRVFYFDKPPQNESLSLVTDSSATGASNSGPAVSYGFSVESPTDFIVPEYPQVHGISIRAGGANSSTPVSLATIPIPVRGLFLLNEQGSGTFTACNRTIPYYNQEYMITVEYLYNSDAAPDGRGKAVVPDGCVPIRLVPICADLPVVPPGSLATHEYIQPTTCYNNIHGTQ
ncbi:hypothetical protein SCUCBS95973_001602 [Sporothrix curviconia]|uniref:DUF7907 domain-containing protein n=1 Tax=Sporothrix curviconia TaxID=1260050 RepID=A0ABP0B0A6_9PEZI